MPYSYKSFTFDLESGPFGLIVNVSSSGLRVETNGAGLVTARLGRRS